MRAFLRRQSSTISLSSIKSGDIEVVKLNTLSVLEIRAGRVVSGQFTYGRPILNPHLPLVLATDQSLLRDGLLWIVFVSVVQFDV